MIIIHFSYFQNRKKRVKWRQNAGLLDGSYHKVDLVGGYYVDHGYVKYGYPMAAAMTVLAWGIERYKRALMISDEYKNAMKGNFKSSSFG